MDLFESITVYVLTGLVGLCVGSFLNVVIYRVPKGMSLSKPRSHCPACGYVLRWYDNIPVLSYLILGGRCRKCKARISLRYTLVELANMLLWLLAVRLFWEESIPLACIYAAVSSVFLCVFFIDLEQMLIFDRFHVILLALGLAATALDPDYGWASHVLGGVLGFGSFFLISWGYEKLRMTEGLGGGDVKLAGVVGLLLGWQKLLLGLLMACVPAAIIMSLVFACGRKTRKDDEEAGRFPFAPFLIVGFSVAMFFGTAILSWYMGLFRF